MALDTNIKLIFNCLNQKTLSDGQVVVDNFVLNLALALKTGVAADQADKLLHVQRQLAPGTNENLDIVGALTDAFGDLFSAVKIKFMAVVNLDTVHTFTFKPGSSNSFVGPFGAATHTLSIKPSNGLPGSGNQSCIIPIWDPNGYVVTGGTGDIVNVAVDAGGSAANYALIVVATSA